MKKLCLLLALFLLLVGLIPACAPNDITEDVYFGNIYPNSDNASDIGANGSVWHEIWVDTLYATEVVDTDNRTDHSQLSNLDYATCGHTGLVPTDNLGSGSADNTTYLRGDQTWATVTAGTVNHSELTDLNWANAGHTIDTDVDFNKFKAIEMVCDNGATVPASPAAGQWYLHTPTGRNVLMLYDGSNWVPIISLGTMTMYVDATDGSDGMDYGGSADSGAFKTVQYAVDRIPGLVGGNVVININGEAYAETVTIQGKSFAGNYSITLQGTLTQQSTGTIESAIQGSGATQGSVTDTSEFGGYDNKLIYANSEYRIIDSDTADTATIIGTWSATPSGTWIVYDWGTELNRLNIGDGQIGIYLYDANLVGDGSFSVWMDRNAMLITNRISTGSRILQNSKGYYWGQCSYHSTDLASTLQARFLSQMVLWRSKIVNTGNNQQIIWVLSQGNVRLVYGCVLDGDAGGGNKANYGIRAELNSVAEILQGVADGYGRVRNCDTGIYAVNGATVRYTANIQYSNNTVDETADAASYGYID